MSKIGTKIIVEELCPLSMPKKANPDDAAYDLFTNGDFKVTPNKRVYIPLGFKIQLPTNMCMIIQPRSGQSGNGMITMKSLLLIRSSYMTSFLHRNMFARLLHKTLVLLSQVFTLLRISQKAGIA